MTWTISWLRQLGNAGAVRNAADAVEAPHRSSRYVESVLQRVAHCDYASNTSRAGGSVLAQAAARDPPRAVTDATSRPVS